MHVVNGLHHERHAQELRESWQARMLVYTQRREIGAVVLSILAHYYDAEKLELLLKIIYPGFHSIKAPFICSAAKVAKNGTVVADALMSDDDEFVTKDVVIFRSLDNMKGQLRRLADKMKLDDTDRLEFFTLARAWVVADRRLDPTMNPADPDAKRLVN